MNAFELYLLKSDDLPTNVERLLEAFRAEGWIRQLRTDHCRFVYRNEDTGVFFQILAAQLQAEEMQESESPIEDEDGEETADSEPVDEEPAIELAPVTFTLPFLCPSFFGREAVAVAERIASTAGLEVGAGERAAAASDIIAEWDRANRDATAAFEDQKQLTFWTPEESTAWWQYGSHCAALDAELAPLGVNVPRLQAARHGNRVKSLFIWDEGTPSVFPRADLVLVRRERERKGLLFTRRVTEEGLVGSEKLWEILEPFSERRESPARLLIFREARNPPQQIKAQLETLVLEPVESAKRQELFGVIDFAVTSNEKAAL